MPRPATRHRGVLLCMLLGSCAATQPTAKVPQPPAATRAQPMPTVATPKQLPPGPQPRPPVRFPAIVRAETKSGLELDTVELGQLPLVQLKLVIRSGSATDPEKLPGLAHLTGAMLKEGTLRRSSVQLAEAVDYLGASLAIDSNEDRTVISIEALAEHFDQALGLIGEIATTPAFNAAELDKLKKRELARLELRAQSPHFLAARELHKAIYGAHPYAHVDTTPETIAKVRRDDLVSWHRDHFAPNNAFLIATGAVTPEQVAQSAERAFARWAKRPVPALKYPDPPARSQREVIIVDRHHSVQSVIYHGNLALPRVADDFIPLMVANQVLGGSAAARLFMDLREKRGLTYGAYSQLAERQQLAPFSAYASVRTEVTSQAMAAFEEHLLRMVREAPQADELVAAKHYLIDRFPLRIESAGKVADLVSDLRTYGLPDDYWDKFGGAIEAVTAQQALAAAQKYIRPDQSVIVVVGEAALIRPTLAAYGPTTVVDTNGKLVLKPRSATARPPQTLPATVAPATGNSSGTKASPQPPGADAAPPNKEH